VMGGKIPCRSMLLLEVMSSIQIIEGSGNGQVSFQSSAKTTDSRRLKAVQVGCGRLENTPLSVLRIMHDLAW
jgi:hypothetical protein